MKKVEWRTPNRMKIDTGHKTFDRQCDCLMTGNVIGNTQYSNFIRPYNETECNGFTNPKGYLQEFDLKHFTSCPRYVIAFVKEAALDKSVILYEIRHWIKEPGKEHRKYVHGYIVTDGKSDELLATFTTGRTHKSHAIIRECVKYLSN